MSIEGISNFILGTSNIKMSAFIDDLPNETLADGILLKLSLANRLNQQRTCRRWKALMPFKDEHLRVIPLVEEMLQLWHRDNEMEIEENGELSVVSA